jgi:hypothetical protein
MGIPTNKQYARSAQKMKGGGFSMSARTGRDAKAGWMVARKSDTHMTKVTPETATGPGLKSAMGEHRGAMFKEGFMGGWANQQGHGEVEPSRRYRDTERGFMKATTQMHAHNQEAMYNPGTERMHYNTAHPANANMSRDQFAENRANLSDWAMRRLSHVDPELHAKTARIMRLHA